MKGYKRKGYKTIIKVIQEFVIPLKLRTLTSSSYHGLAEEPHTSSQDRP